MALSREDKADVKGAMGKALANKVEKVTKDNKMVKIHLGQKAKDNFGYTISDHKGKVLKQGGSHLSAALSKKK